MTAFDPDLSASTRHVATRKYHAVCRASGIQWIHPVIDAIGTGIGLPASARPEMVGEFDLEIYALSGDSDSAESAPMLLVTAEVTEDHGQGARAWLHELERYLRENGFGSPDSLGLDDPEWSVRLEPGDAGVAPWIVLRTDRSDTPGNLVVCTPEGADAAWCAAAQQASRVRVVFGPCTGHWREDTLIGEEPEELLAERGAVTGEDAGRRCSCAAVDTPLVWELIEDGHFLTGLVPLARMTAE